MVVRAVDAIERKRREKKALLKEDIRRSEIAAQKTKLCEALGTSEAEFDEIKIEYTSHWIPKRTGGRRKLDIPSDGLKQLQKKILHKLVYREKTHPFSYGFRKRKSIVDNARPHCNSAVVIKLDIKDFFPSIKKDQVRAVFQNFSWDRELSDRLSELCCWQGVLPQGAPTSPALSNIILKPIDDSLSHLALRNGAVYTRYADDITYSLNSDDSKKIGVLIKVTQSELAKLGFKLNFKKGKIRVLRRHQHQEICGITVNTKKPTLSRKKRRLIRAAKHRLDNGLYATMTIEQIEGWENFNRMVDAEHSHIQQAYLARPHHSSAAESPT